MFASWKGEIRNISKLSIFSLDIHVFAQNFSHVNQSYAYLVDRSAEYFLSYKQRSALKFVSLETG